MVRNKRATVYNTHGRYGGRLFSFKQPPKATTTSNQGQAERTIGATATTRQEGATRIRRAERTDRKTMGGQDDGKTHKEAEPIDNSESQKKEKNETDAMGDNKHETRTRA